MSEGSSPTADSLIYRAKSVDGPPIEMNGQDSSALGFRPDGPNWADSAPLTAEPFCWAILLLVRFYELLFYLMFNKAWYPADSII